MKECLKSLHALQVQMKTKTRRTKADSPYPTNRAAPGFFKKIVS
jgi:hypothetical protein